MTGQHWAVLGGGDHARVIAALLRRLGHRLEGWIGPPAEKAVPEGLGRWLGDDDVALSAAEWRLAVGVGSVGTTERRTRAYCRWRERGFEFPALIDPSAILIDVEELARVPGLAILAGTVVQVGVRLGENALLNTGARVDHDCVIGAHAHLAPGVTLSGNVRVGDRAHLGTGAIVIQGVRIGDDAVVGAGAVVLKDLAARSRAWGSPAQARDPEGNPC